MIYIALLLIFAGLAMVLGFWPVALILGGAVVLVWVAFATDNRQRDRANQEFKSAVKAAERAGWRWNPDAGEWTRAESH